MEKYLNEVKRDYIIANGYEIGDEFIFAVVDGSEFGIGLDYCLYIQPKSYWDNEGCLCDQHVLILNLPDGIEEVMESTFEYDGTIEDNIEELLNRGFIFDKGFQDFADNNVRLNNNLTVSEFIDSL